MTVEVPQIAFVPDSVSLNQVEEGGILPEELENSGICSPCCASRVRRRNDESSRNPWLGGETTQDKSKGIFEILSLFGHVWRFDLNLEICRMIEKEQSRYVVVIVVGGVVVGVTVLQLLVLLLLLLLRRHPR